jgi:molecular chaperone HscB
MRKPPAGVANRSRCETLQQPDYFELLGLPASFDLDEQTLEAHWKDRASAVHPDRFPDSNPAQKRVALQWSAQVNEAYRVLKNPLRRAQYLCERAGHPAQGDGSVSMSPDFLMQQMQWREALEELQAQGNALQVTMLGEDIQTYQTKLQSKTREFMKQARWEEVSQCIHEWMFVDKFLHELKVAQRGIRNQEA